MFSKEDAKTDKMIPVILKVGFFWQWSLQKPQFLMRKGVIEKEKFQLEIISKVQQDFSIKFFL